MAPVDKPNQSRAEWISSSENRLEAILEVLKWLEQVRQANMGTKEDEVAAIPRIPMMLAMLPNESIEGLLDEFLTSLGDCRLRWLLTSSGDPFIRWSFLWGRQQGLPQKQPGAWDVVLCWGTDQHAEAEARWMVEVQHWWEPARLFWPKLLRNPAKLKKLQVRTGCVWGVIWAALAVVSGVFGARLWLLIVILVTGAFLLWGWYSFRCISWNRLRIRQWHLIRLAFQQSTIKELTELCKVVKGEAELFKSNENLQSGWGRRRMIVEMVCTLQSELRKQRDALLTRVEQLEWRLATA
jgi:hypothetical protein